MTDTDTLRQRAQAFLAAADKAPPAPWGLEIDFADDDWGHSHSFILGVKDAEGKLAFHFEDQPDNAQKAVALFALVARNDAPSLVADLLAESEVIAPALSEVTRRCKSLEDFASAQTCKVLDLQLANARQAAEITRLARELATAREQTALALARVEQLEQSAPLLPRPDDAQAVERGAKAMFGFKARLLAAFLAENQVAAQEIYREMFSAALSAMGEGKCR